MNKLIVVGMRHIGNDWQSKIKSGDMADLYLEKNGNGVDNKAFLVKIRGVKIGYIRNQDLPELFKYSQYKSDVLQHYKVEVIRANYIVLQRDTRCYRLDSTAADNNYADIPKAMFEQEYEARYTGSNPCNEINITEPKISHFNTVAGVSSNKQKESNKMAINTNSMRDQFFREVKNVAIDIQSGKFGIVSTDGISVFDKGTVNVNPIQELGVKIPAFAMRVAADTLAPGDIVFNGAEAGFFVEAIKEGGYKLMSTSGEVTTVGNVKNMFFGANSVLAVKNMFAGSGMNPMMMAMFMGDGKMDSKTLMMMAMMGGQGAGGGMDSNMLMMMMLMGDK